VQDVRTTLVDWVARQHPGRPIRVVETHISVLAFAGDRVYKAKKDVRFPFVDLSTAELRAADCVREVTLNRRFAPDVYLGVAEVSDATGRVVDHAVEMRHLPDDRRLAALVRSDVDVGPCLDGLARDLAAIHGAAPTGGAIDDATSHAAVAELWELGIDQVQRFAGDVVAEDDADDVARLARQYMAGRRPLFDARVAAHRARDGHGDLLAEDVFCLAVGPRAIDCLEFDDRLRYGDVLADIAFLAMDLEHLGRRDLAERFIATYREAADDDWPASLEHMYIAYRAHVRAKVACLRSAQGDHGAAVEARELLALAVRHLHAGRVRLVLVGGAPASGKSTLAAGLGRTTGWHVLRSDVVRKERAGLHPTTKATASLDEGIYDARTTADTYRALLDRAAHTLRSGENVIIDASWSDAERREEAAALAVETSSHLIEVQCVAPDEVRAARAAARAEAGTDASDVDAGLARALGARFAAWPSATLVDTTRDPAVVCDEVVRHLLSVAT
jgi:aminoglycoside phosphotransferase family enzyme/predicted kinase